MGAGCSEGGSNHRGITHIRKQGWVQCVLKEGGEGLYLLFRNTLEVFAHLQSIAQ